MPEGRRPRGVTPRPRSGVAAETARLRRQRNSREESQIDWAQILTQLLMSHMTLGMLLNLFVSQFLHV